MYLRPADNQFLNNLLLAIQIASPLNIFIELASLQVLIKRMVIRP